MELRILSRELLDVVIEKEVDCKLHQWRKSSGTCGRSFAELQTELTFDRENLITVAINNTLSSDTVPQGTTVYQNSARWLYFTNDYKFDFFNYAGIHRSVFLYTTPKTFIDDIDVFTRVETVTGYGYVNYSIKAEGSTSKKRKTNIEAVTFIVELEDKEGTVVGRADGSDGEIAVPNAKLWWPFTMVPDDEDAGYLYTLKVTTLETASNKKDIYRLKVGIRTVSWTEKEFQINNSSFYFRGFGRHEDYDVRGKGVDNVMLVKDHNLIKWTGANSYRTTHYPYAEEIMDLADRLGIVIIDEVPAVSIEGYGSGLLANHKKQMKNRASVVMWSVLNEPWNLHEEAAGVYFKDVIDHTKEVDSRIKRPVTLVCNMYTMHNEDKSSPEFVFTEEYQTVMMKEHFKAFDYLRANSSFIGEHIWNFADFMTTQGIHRVGGNRKGIFTRQRQPKASAHLLRHRYHLMAAESDNYPIPQDILENGPVYTPKKILHDEH